MTGDRGGALTSNQLAQLHGSGWIGKEQKTEMTEGSWGRVEAEGGVKGKR